MLTELGPTDGLIGGILAAYNWQTLDLTAYLAAGALSVILDFPRASA